MARATFKALSAEMNFPVDVRLQVQNGRPVQCIQACDAKSSIFTFEDSDRREAKLIRAAGCSSSENTTDTSGSQPFATFTCQLNCRIIYIIKVEDYIQ